MSEPPAIPRGPAETVALARFLAATRAEGPGERTAIWVQGCAIRCPGCFNPHLWGSRGGEQVVPHELARRVLDAGTDGLTLLGGEPFDQAAALARVAAEVGAAGRSVMTFTGYTRSQLDAAVDAGRTDVAPRRPAPPPRPGGAGGPPPPPPPPPGAARPPTCWWRARSRRIGSTSAARGWAPRIRSSCCSATGSRICWTSCR